MSPLSDKDKEYMQDILGMVDRGVNELNLTAYVEEINDGHIDMEEEVLLHVRFVQPDGTEFDPIIVPKAQ